MDVETPKTEPKKGTRSSPRGGTAGSPKRKSDEPAEGEAEPKKAAAE